MAGLLLAGCLLGCFASGRLAAQSLGELAHEQRARKSAESNPAKVYTNDNMTVSSVLPSAIPEQKGAGEMDVIYQSFYNRINNTTISNMNGAAFSFREFVPERGLLSLRLEPMLDHGSFAAGENYARWKGLPWKGRHWDFDFGDFQISTALQPMPFVNLFEPDFFLRGAKISVRSDKWQYSFYAGMETLAQGPRIPFRERVPQNAIGVETAGQPWKRLKLGVRYLHLTTSDLGSGGLTSFLTLSRRFSRSDSLTTQATLQLTHHLEWYTEAGWNNVATLSPTQVAQTPFSFVSGPSWNSPHFVFHANYVRQGADYLPLLGYFLGDRQGVNVDSTVQLGRLGLSGSVSQSHNNLEKDPSVPDFSSRQASAGIQVRLPRAFSLSASFSRMDLQTNSPQLGSSVSNNRQFNVSLSHAFFRHNLRASFQQLDLQSRDLVQRLRFMELEDTYHWSRFTVGGAVRWQHANDTGSRDSLFFRGSAQVQLAHFSVYSYIEEGKDLVNSTLFATNAMSTSVAGISWSGPHHFGVQMEALRNRSNTNLNPESVFVLSNQGVPLDSTLASFNNWSVYLRATEHFGWGQQLSVNARGEIQQQAPLTGVLAGFVRLRTMEGKVGAPDVSLTLDSGVEVKTDRNGYFEITRTPEGQHTIALDLNRLPASLNPTHQTRMMVGVLPEKTTRVEFQVVPLQTLTGTVRDRDGKPVPDGIVIRLLPGNRYTTTDESGRFDFYNVPEGNYTLKLDESTLPKYAHLLTVPELSVRVRYGTATAPAKFDYRIIPPPPKPVEKILLGERSVVVIPSKGAAE